MVTEHLIWGIQQPVRFTKTAIIVSVIVAVVALIQLTENSIGEQFCLDLPVSQIEEHSNTENQQPAESHVWRNSEFDCMYTEQIHGKDRSCLQAPPTACGCISDQ